MPKSSGKTLQNRIAQRNHRQRVKESKQAAEEQSSSSQPSEQSTEQAAEESIPADSEEAEDPERPSPDSISPTGNIPEKAMTDAGSEKGQAQPPPPFDPMMLYHMGDGTSLPNQSMFHTPFCGCNGATGPCVRHLEEMRYQLMQSSQMSPRAMASQMHPRGHGSLTGPLQMPLDNNDRMLDVSGPGNEYTRHMQGMNQGQIPPMNQPSSSLETLAWQSQLSAGLSAGPPNNMNSRSKVSKSSTNSSTGSSTNLSRHSQTGSPPGRQGVSLTRTTDWRENASDNTARFTPILEAVHEAGFADWDSMIAAYYTCAFQKSSWPDMSQRASRTRRLSKLISEMQESSETWPKWESRAFRESVMESAQKICVSELDAIVKSVDLQHDTEGCFFEEITNKSSHVQPPGRNQDPYGSNPLASLGTLPDSVESAVQNEALHTWSLLTELAGPQGLYCDRVTHAMTALLIDSRRA